MLFGEEIVKVTGLPLVFSKFFPGSLNFFHVFNSTHFWVYFNLKLSLIQETDQISIKILNGYCKGTLMCFLIKKIMMTIKNILMIGFLCQIEILLLNILKLLKIPGFY